MKLDYIEKVNEHGDHIVRLYDFDASQAAMFRQTLKETVIANKTPLDLTTLDFIQATNCYLTLRISASDIGITTTDRKRFYCDLTTKAYEQMVFLIEPFCMQDDGTYQWLYDTGSQIDLLFSPKGIW